MPEIWKLVLKACSPATDRVHRTETVAVAESELPVSGIQLERPSAAGFSCSFS